MLYVFDSESQTGKTIAVVPVVDNLDLRKWMLRMGFSYDRAAEMLGIHRSTFGTMLNGTSRETGRQLPLPRSIQLAAMAIELGIDQKLPPPVMRKKPRRNAQQVCAQADAQSIAALQEAIKGQSGELSAV